MNALLIRSLQLGRLSSRPASKISAAPSVASKTSSTRAVTLSLGQRSVLIQARNFSLSKAIFSQKSSSKDEPDLRKLTDNEYVEHYLPAELQSLKPTPPIVWISVLVALAIVGAALPWKSFIDHIFYPPEEEDDD